MCIHRNTKIKYNLYLGQGHLPASRSIFGTKRIADAHVQVKTASAQKLLQTTTRRYVLPPRLTKIKHTMSVKTQGSINLLIVKDEKGVYEIHRMSGHYCSTKHITFIYKPTVINALHSNCNQIQ